MKKMTFLFFLSMLSLNVFSQHIIEDEALVGWINPPAEIVIPDEASSIKRGVLSDNPTITSVDFNNVSIIESGALKNCIRLDTVNMPNVRRVNARALEGAVRLEHVSIPQGVIIQALAFNGCRSLTSVELPSMRVIKRGAFSQCRSLTTVDLSKAVNLREVEGSGDPNNAPFDLNNKNLTIYVSDESKMDLFPAPNRRKYTVKIK
jgi:hypothetical protein